MRVLLSATTLRYLGLKLTPELVPVDAPFPLSFRLYYVPVHFHRIYINNTTGTVVRNNMKYPLLIFRDNPRVGGVWMDIGLRTCSVIIREPVGDPAFSHIQVPHLLAHSRSVMWFTSWMVGFGDKGGLSGDAISRVSKIILVAMS